MTRALPNVHLLRMRLQSWQPLETPHLLTLFIAAIKCNILISVHDREVVAMTTGDSGGGGGLSKHRVVWVELRGRNHFVRG